MPEIKYSLDDRFLAMKLYRRGLSCSEVENKTGVHRSSVRAWARQSGIIRKKGSGSFLTDEEKGIVEHLYTAKNFSRRDIERKTGIDQHRAYRHLKKQGLIRPRGHAVSIAQAGRTRHSRYIKLLDAAAALSIKKVNAVLDHLNLNWLDLAEACGTSLSTILEYRACGHLPESIERKITEYLLSKMDH